ncbi:MAG: alpha-ketoglutarate-dependent dioxygenase AlkB [Xanthomonadales bacterium]|nr:alpha-ketoglutarate-dependent dioxygenase AlkB [Xanthomonadales bacterium]
MAPAWQPLPLPGAQVGIARTWLAAAQADALFAAVETALTWSQHAVSLFGRRLPAPRLSCWIGDAGADYRYSGTRHAPHPWPDALVELRRCIERACGAPFNSVLANRYRHGQDSMGWHADDEPELGAEPVIASLSLGGERTMRFRSREGGTRFGVALGHGDLLVMRGATQRTYQHAVPKSRAACMPRINLTFRQIVPPPQR